MTGPGCLGRSPLGTTPAKCAGPGRVNGPYKGDQGYRKLGREKASTLSCGTSGYPLEMKVVNVKP